MLQTAGGLKTASKQGSSFIKDLENEASAIKLEYNLLKENSNDAHHPTGGKSE